MAKYHVTITRPNPTNRFPLCFHEMAKLIQGGLRDIGHECTRRENRLEEDAINIVFNWHEWQGKGHPVQMIRDNQVILFQGEQITAGGRILPDWYFQGLEEAHAVWDYSEDNVEMLKANGIAAKHVPPAWHPSMKIIEQGETKELDVLFYGAPNIRREFLMKQIGQVCAAKFLVDVWGDERNDLIAQSKLVLNIHFYESQTLELLRLAPLLANRVPVVSEHSALNPYGPDGIRMVPYREILPAVVKLLRNDPARLALGEKGYEIFGKTRMVDVLQSALEIKIDSLAASDIPKQHDPLVC